MTATPERPSRHHQAMLREILRGTRTKWPSDPVPLTRRRWIRVRLENFVLAERPGGQMTRADRCLFKWTTHRNYEGPLPPQPPHPAEGSEFDAAAEWRADVMQRNHEQQMQWQTRREP